jgi:PAS domain S-box-containing protein
MPASDNHVSSVSDGNIFPEKQIKDVPDISQRLLIDEQLRRCRECYLQLMALCTDGIFLVLNGRIAYVNQAGVDLLGEPDADQLLGRSLLDAVRIDFSKVTHDYIESQLNSCQCCSPLRGKLRRVDGSTADIELLTAAYYNHDSTGSIVILRDIAKPLDNAAELIDEDYLRLIADTIPALIAYVSNEERYLFINAAYETWFNRPRTDIVGHTLSEVLGSAYSIVAAHVAKALNGEIVSYEAKVKAPLKGERTLAIVYAPDKSTDGTVRGFSLVAMDITTRRQRETVFQEHERRVWPSADTVPLLIAQCDKEYRLRFVNKSYAGRFGFDPKKAIGCRIPDLIGEERFALFRQYIDAALAGKIQEHEVKLPSQNVGDRYVHMMYVPECDENGEVRSLIAAFNNTTRLRRAEDQLHRRELEFKTLVENSPDIVSRIDRGMRHLYVNPAIERAFGINTAIYLGKTKSELGLPADMVLAWDNAAQAAFETGMEKRFDHEITIDGKTRHFSTRVIPEPDRNGNIDSLLGITYDITERTRIERERDELLARERMARIQAETAARARDEFLAVVSHELRAPLNGIQSWAHVLENYVKEATAAPLAQRALQGIKTGVAQQVRLIEDLLDVTRMMSGKLRLVKQPLAVLPIIQAAVESVRDIGAAKRISISSTYKITNEQIEGDSDRIQQIIWNLLSNAVKFTPENGNIWLTASRADSNLCVTIRDDGIGISPDFLPYLFDRFSQEDTSSTRGHSGLGLGLFLVRYLIELHGGRVNVTSEGEGKGATFSVYMPLRSQRNKYTLASSSDDTADSHVTLPSLNGLHILLIDDQEEARESLTVVLTAAGANIFAAESAKEALDWLPSLAVDEMPDILICDIAMPGEDGYSVLRKIRAWKTESDFAPLRRLPALALTAFAQREDRIRALTAGFQMHITKPVAPEELIVVIATMVSRG